MLGTAKPTFRLRKKPAPKPFDLGGPAAPEEVRLEKIRLLGELLDGESFQPEELSIVSGVVKQLQANLAGAAAGCIRQEYIDEFGAPPEAFRPKNGSREPKPKGHVSGTVGRN
jgi:hypothetical protein